MLLEFYVEEESAEAALVYLVPAILPAQQFDFEIYPFAGKPALLRHLPNRLRAYRHFTTHDWRIVVLRDRDDDDCLELKKQLEAIAQDVGLPTRSQHRNDFKVINRIAIEELEARFFGDVEALTAAYPRVDSHLAAQARFRDPDAIRGGTWEQLERVLAHYHPGGLEKKRAAEEIAQHMIPERNRSASFQVFRRALVELFDTGQTARED
jgi:hypothetical protein